MSLVDQLKEQFDEAILSIEEFKGESTLKVKIAGLFNILSFIKESQGFDVLTDLSGVDYVAYTYVFYWLQNPKTCQRMRIAVDVDRDEKLPSVTGIWAAADWFERELYDLFGLNFDGHPDLKRILMPDEWEGHPLRRDYPLTEVGVVFKHGVKPKVPSETIPFVPFERKKRPGW